MNTVLKLVLIIFEKNLSMKYNFNKQIKREGTNCYKYDIRNELYGREDVLPMWVADMDIEVPDFIVEAIKERLNHKVFGYSFHSDGFKQSITDWNKRRNNWNIKNEWISFSPGIVPALNMLVMGFTEPGDKILVQPPVYFPFFSAVTNHRRTLIKNSLQFDGEKYIMDYEDLENKFKEGVKMFFLCSPHNPVGRVWKKYELEKVAELALKYNVLVIADEIHSDIIMPGNKHIPFASLGDDISKNTITCMAPSKTFNLAGLSTSYLIIQDDKLKEKYEKVLDHVHVGHGNIFGDVSCQAAYENGDDWVDALNQHLQANIDYLSTEIENELPKIKVIKPEGTYLVWLDFGEYNMAPEELKNLLINEGKLGLSDGGIFGKEGIGFQRVNVGCPLSTVKEAIQNLKKAMDFAKK